MTSSWLLDKKQLNRWIYAAILLFIFTSIIEFAHQHGVVTDVDSHCALCHQGSHAQAPLEANNYSLLVLASYIFFAFFVAFISIVPRRTFLIRAPPV